MWIGWLEFDYLLGDVHSLKQKRSLTKPLIAEIRRRFTVTVSEVGHLDLHRRAAVGVGVVGADRTHVSEVLDAVERFGADRPEITLVSVRRLIISADDLD